ncbi:hypothetical protein Scep_017810 [Stephania cephalantha]|uniref:protein-disulfide reductase n=1 Tax=Stephania cephalantha TaxID=152367 RepID=A0AAP0IS44_9MAGN
MADAEATTPKSHDLQALLSSDGRDFLVRNNGDQVKTSELTGKTVGLYFSASWCGPCRRFTPKLIETYNDLHPKNTDHFEVVFLSADRDQDSFNEYFSKMPWLAVPFSDEETRDRLDALFEVNGIPHLVIVDPSGKVVSEEGVGVVGDYGVDGYPFTEERIKELKDEEERARRDQSLRSLLVSTSRDFLISSDGTQVPVASLEGKIVGLYFSASAYGPCVDFAKKLVEVHGELNKRGESFQVVLVSLDSDEDSFKETLEGMPWLALPFNDKTCSKLLRYFELSALPTLVIIGQDGKTLHPNVAELVEEYGAQAYPFTPEKVAELEEIEKARKEAQTLESILVSGDRDFVIRNGGSKVLVSELVGKNILLYFSAHWCPPCRAFLPKLIEAYHEIKAKDDGFEVIFISSDRTQEAFDEFFSSMPWLALPFGDERKKSLSRTFNVSGIPTVIAIGANGKTVTDEAREILMTHGAKAYPFTAERLKEIEEEIEEMAKGWPEELKSALHDEHELHLTRRRTYVCDGCNDQGTGLSFYCGECDFDLHPNCALLKDEGTANGDADHEEEAPNEGWVCDGNVCTKA